MRLHGGEFTLNKKDIARLRRTAKTFNITQDAIAREARVDRTMVSKVFNYHAKSRPVLDAAQRLIARRITDAQAVLETA